MVEIPFFNKNSEKSGYVDGASPQIPILTPFDLHTSIALSAMTASLSTNPSPISATRAQRPASTQARTNGEFAPNSATTTINSAVARSIFCWR